MALVSDSLLFLGEHIWAFLLSVLVLHFTRSYFTPGVASIPGPLLAKITNLWRFIDVANGHAEVTLYELHQKHGDYVRLGPRVVSVQNLDALKTIYGINKGYEKTNFYHVQQQLAKGKPTPTLFTTTDEEFHAAIKRPVSSAYSMSTLTEFEPFVDTTIHTLFRKLDEFVAEKKVCDIATWLQYYAFDVIGELTFSKPLGFLDHGADVDGIIAALEKMLDYSGKIGQMPWLDYLFIKNPLRQLVQGGSTGAVARFARARLNERLQESASAKKGPVAPIPLRRDFLARFLEAKKEHPHIVNDNQVFSYTVSNMNAGSDTTAISLRAILYYTLKSPRVKSKLFNELSTAYKQKRITMPVSWKQSQEELPYLDAVIREALRLHPAVGLLLERIVPPSGLQLPDGPFLPAGTIVGANPWIIHRHAIFGNDVDSFIPERWMQVDGETELEFQVRRQQMLRATFTFGAGPRTCIGKNISLLEIYKLIPSLILNYQIELEHPKREWETTNAWFVRQKHMDVRLTCHNPGAFEVCGGEK
ncbi:Cytochrome P450 [Penicillium macrosclerotiorum]|uniref:Cytochrome P450 n=1 Tax=Penicillium macrosclerotiorum TaxID=303699 RepID=UPI0025474796|nr:Cytochrome P450 [Penicillium macrosclerotiorum]KAJ5692861.1 Cytochrome P450 [Penicillium macrosclerotiorum]